jgi:hypothetical protein
MTCIPSARGRLLSVALEQMTLADRAQPLFRAVLPGSGTIRRGRRRRICVRSRAASTKWRS